MKILNWNINWARPDSIKGRKIQEIIKYFDPDLVCLTETYIDFYLPNRYSVFSEDDYGYKQTGNKRKVILFSNNKWNQIQYLSENSEMPKGRIIIASNEFNLKKINVIGVCIPWKFAHVNTGKMNRSQWQDHSAYLSNLGNYIYSLDPQIPTIVIGDFNQTIPRTIAPIDMNKKLLATFKSYNIISRDQLDECNKPIIDHIAINRELSNFSFTIIPKNSSDGIKISDHSGILAEFDF